MGVINLYNASSLCTSGRPSWGRSRGNRPSCGIAMASSTVPVQQQQVNDQPLTGDSFIRPHLRNLSPYQPILPFEVFKFDTFFPLYPFQSLLAFRVVVHVSEKRVVLDLKMLGEGLL